MSDRRKQLEAVDTDHVVTRAWERYRVKLLAADLAKLTNQCRVGHALLLKVAPDGAEHRLVRHDGIAMRALWLPVSQRIATFLPMSTDPTKRPGVNFGARDNAKSNRWPERRPRFDED